MPSRDLPGSFPFEQRRPVLADIREQLIQVAGLGERGGRQPFARGAMDWHAPGPSEIQVKRQYGDSISMGLTNTHRQHNHKSIGHEGGQWG
jgi:hypothetical protein